MLDNGLDRQKGKVMDEAERGPAAVWLERYRKSERENERLRAFARDARALAYSGDCDACGATDELLDLVEKHGLDGP